MKKTTDESIKSLKPLTKSEPVKDVEGRFAVSVKSDRYHYPEYWHTNIILPDNEIPFGKVDEAKSKGYVPYGECKLPNL